MFPLYFLELMLDNNKDNIEEVPDYVMTLLNLIRKRNIQFGFLPSTFLQQVKQKYKSMKWLRKFIVLCIESLHRLWLERCKIVYESMASRVKIKDYNNLLNEVKLLFGKVEIRKPSTLHQYKYKLNHISVEKLRGVAYE